MPAPSGKVLYPPYIQSFHVEALDNSVTVDSSGVPTGTFTLDTDAVEIMNTVWAAANPLNGAVAYAPDDDLLTIQDRIDDYTGIIMNMDDTATWEEMLDVATSRIDDILPSDDEVGQDIDAFNAQQLTNLARSYNRVSIQFQDTNSVISTTFPSALAMLEIDYNNTIAKYEAERRLALSSERATSLLRSIDQMARVLSWRLTSSATSAQLQNAKGGLSITSKSSQVRQDVDWEIRELMWDFEPLRAGLSAMGSIGGIPGFPEGLTKEQQALSGLANFAQFAIPLATLIL
jgi:hypothetical protein